MSNLGAGVTQIAFSSIAVWSVLLSTLLLDSRFSTLQLFGTVVLLTAIWIAQYEKGDRINRSVLLVVASGCCFALFQVASADIADAVTGGTYVLLAHLGPGLITLIVFWRTFKVDYQSLTGSRMAAIRSTLPASVTSVAYYVFAYFAYREAPDPGVVIILLSSQVIVAVILAMIFLGERRHPKRTLAAGVLAVLAGAAIKS